MRQITFNTCWNKINFGIKFFIIRSYFIKSKIFIVIKPFSKCLFFIFTISADFIR
uniref:Uncharacterized protein n=1 Tax=Siphoviridae sp. ctxMM9 TaxID=2827973 RepID=A0A8S5T673_9CAUD|nr:MAG TPA: hypothetical protein [Siphoviridae sp. ctxMM9]